jgi:predicted dehydrogenase
MGMTPSKERMNETIRWGIWGAGIIAEKVANDFRFAPGNQLYAVASRTFEHAKAFAARHQASASYNSLHALLADPQVDAVYIATPNHLHVGDCIACLEAGKAVLCEKPFALNFVEAERIAAAARSRGVFCMEAMWTRFIPAVVEAKRRVDAGELGRVRLLEGSFAHLAAAGDAGRLFDPQMGGGVLLDLGVYLLSMCQYLIGEPQSAKGVASLANSGVDDQSAYQLTYASGALANLAASLRVKGTNEFNIAGDLGSLRLHQPFCATRRLTFTAYAQPSAASASMQRSSKDKARQSLRNSRMAQTALDALAPLTSFVRGTRSVRFPFPGYGYQFQLLEVSQCLRQGKTESSIMPLADSLSVMRTMDQLRAQWGLRYPGEG